ncbi:hypothetical protein RJ640_007652 [Escallonia rubra]|uniref:Ubiquinone biosynthesis monooxygenase COQ6, mitochondrial n=1 Tax=Escallonia rubra TaxID=112253 RepID=A0AA88QKF9_9ASTE|nr:hypothetical protein RJ640_007652 [Escallonia rubra]
MTLDVGKRNGNACQGFRLPQANSRLTAGRVASRIYGLKYAGRTFCGLAPTELSGSSTSQKINELEDDPNRTTNIRQYDIAIVGGGMVGMALACSIASMPLTKHLTVAIIDSNPALASGPCINKDDPPDPRVSTVTPATISLFKGIGAWEYIEQHRHAYFDKMQVWDYTGLGYTKYNAKDVHRQNKDIQKTIFPTRLTSMSLHPSSSSTALDDQLSRATLLHRGNLAKLEMSDGSSLCAKLVVGADGSRSRIRELAGIKTTGWKYSQNAVICTVEHEEENHCAWQRFLPAGPIALLPIGDKFSNIVWTMDPKESSNCKSMGENDFVKAVNHALDYGYGPHPGSRLFGGGNLFTWLGADGTSSMNESFEVPPKVVRLGSERMVFPLSLMHANYYASKRVALIGDAAHTVHPLAGQGVNMGFGDAFSLSKVIAEGVAVGSDIGEVSLLKKYEADRKTANIAMTAILDGFQKAYSVDFGPLNVLRAAAFHGAQYISPLKRSIISYASGEQRLPLIT